MKNKQIKLILFLSLQISALSVFSQDLNLFQATDNPDNRETTSRRPQRTATRSTEPAFTLVGTSRFGEEYYASLLSRSGESVRVQWSPGIVKEIKGYNGFGIADISSRRVSIRVPESEPCIENVEKGVRCNGIYSLLTLSYGEPIASAARVETMNEDVEVLGNPEGDSENIASSEETSTIGDSSTLIRNPFSGALQNAPDLTPEEIASREARRQRRAEQFRNFEIVRIADDEIPAGMQRVRTPFGDSLEPAEE